MIAVFLFVILVTNCVCMEVEGDWNKHLHLLNLSRSNNKLHNHGFHPGRDYWDWRDHGKVTPVKDQGRCESCWSFSIIGNLESQLLIKYDKKLILSEQMLIDCVATNDGCESGTILKGFAYMTSSLGGAVTDKQYPYVGKTGVCRYKPSDPHLQVIGFSRVASDEEVMKNATYFYGPISAAINSASMARYKGGIDEPSHQDCNPEHLDHSVLIVGYSIYVDKHTGKETPYWIIKNSWGRDWGDHGYYYLVRGRNACGISTDVSGGALS